MDEEKPKSLHSLLLALQAADEEMEEIDLSLQIDLMDGAKIKVDNYKYIIDKLETHEAFLKKREDEYAKARRAIQSQVKRIKEHLLFALQSNHFEKFTGFEYVVSQQKAPPSVSLKVSEPTISHAIHFAEFVRTSYDWDKIAIKAALKEGNETVANIAEMKENIYPRFTLNREQK